VNGKEISQDVFVQAFSDIKSVVPEKKYLNYFVFLTLIAVYIISQSKPDVGILEVGIGGIKDPTSGVDPDAVIVTSVAKEHEGVLGFGLESIATAKASLIRNGIPAVVGPLLESIMPIFEKRSEWAKSSLYRFGKDFWIDSKEDLFSYCSETLSLEDLQPSLIGKQQHTNAALAIKSAELLDVTDTSGIRNGLSRSWIRGRFEYLETNVIYDVAHTPESCQFLAENIRKRYKKEDVTLLVSFQKSQIYWKEMIEIMSKVCSKIVGAPIHFHPGRRWIEPSEIQEEAALYGSVAEASDSIIDAFFFLKSSLSDTDVLVINTSAGIGPILDYYKG
jgi:dihydrofolate synthase/folylpolyglutamate synthase